MLNEMRPEIDLSSGELVEDHVVTDALLEYFQKPEYQAAPGFLLDGFPRTSRQIDLTSERWPKHLQISSAIKLNVPDFVCETKLLGRRLCTECNGNFNVNGVHRDGWDLPPSLPPLAGQASSCSKEACEELYWVDRPDDTPDIIRGRLQTYHRHMDPILDHFDERGRLLKLTPYRGYDDVEKMIQDVRRWMDSH